jgi:hypothetical protein
MCTWENCQEEAKHKQVGQAGNVWADLCDAHDKQLKEDLKGPIPMVLAAWVKAQGGSKKAAENMFK